MIQVRSQVRITSFVLDSLNGLLVEITEIDKCSVQTYFVGKLLEQPPKDSGYNLGDEITFIKKELITPKL